MMQQSQTEPAASGAAIAALEQFVVDNDALNELERYVGRFNIFDALGIINVALGSHRRVGRAMVAQWRG